MTSMHDLTDCFTRFSIPVGDITLPERFTFPFYYQPHPLSLLAVKQLQQHLSTQTQWQHNFGLEGDSDGAIGKMFGVLVVKNEAGELGYLSAFSGKLADSNHLPGFVPPVFDMLDEHGFFKAEQLEINRLNAQLETLQQSTQQVSLQHELAELQARSEQQITAFRQHMTAARARRKALREAQQQDSAALARLQQQLSAESIREKLQLRDLKLHWQQQIQRVAQVLTEHNEQIDSLKKQRKTLSAALQYKLFEQYRFLNRHGEQKSLNDVFDGSASVTPPAGSGECAAPKLLQYAFKHGLRPLSLAEFWWGVAPKSEIRQHGNFYPACQGKCQPILAHMLSGMAVDDNPLLHNPALGKSLDILYQDDVMLVVNKPAEFLSVPGKNISDCVYARIKQDFPNATGPLIVHRLDMSTSGLMVIALTKAAHQFLQRQFIQRRVKKRYVALLDGLLPQQSGSIDLPLRGDITDRPRQLVCYQHGRAAHTRWQVIGQTGTQTRVHLYPETGRTHQLRVHCAHPDGLNTPISGDDLYGCKGPRLHLHADLLALTHPVTRQPMQFQVDADF